jgi:hypothetical protein
MKSDGLLLSDYIAEFEILISSKNSCNLNRCLEAQYFTQTHLFNPPVLSRGYMDCRTDPLAKDRRC